MLNSPEKITLCLTLIPFKLLFNYYNLSSLCNEDKYCRIYFFNLVLLTIICILKLGILHIIIINIRLNGECGTTQKNYFANNLLSYSSRTSLFLLITCQLITGFGSLFSFTLLTCPCLFPVLIYLSISAVYPLQMPVGFHLICLLICKTLDPSSFNTQYLKNAHDKTFDYMML